MAEIVNKEGKRGLEGTVIPSKMAKTIVVAVKSYKVHPVYKKRIEVRKKYHVDDPKEEAKPGDVVAIQECRPVSATKRFRLVKVLKKAEE